MHNACGGTGVVRRGVGMLGAGLMAALAVRSAAASTITTESSLFYYYAYSSGGGIQTQVVKDTGENGTTEASTGASYSLPTGSDKVVHLSSLASGQLGSGHLQGSDFFSRGNPNPGTSLERWEADSHVVITLTDVFIKGTPGTTSVTGSINFLIDGSLQPSSTVFGGTDVSAQSSFSAYVYVNDNIVDYGTSIVESDNGNSPLKVQNQEMFANFTGHNTVTTNSTTLPVNTPFSMKLDLYLGTRTGLGETSYGSAQALADFGDTFSFATSGAVFNLPDGYTVNSADGGIVDNSYSLPAEVPEPATIGVMGLGAMAMLRRRRRA